MAEGNNYSIKISDGTKTKDTTHRIVKVDYGKYKVLNTIFKNGKEWKKGEVISLEKVTAERFIKLGDIKEV